MEHIDQLAAAVRGLPNASPHRYAAALQSVLASLRRVDATSTPSAYGGNEDTDRSPEGDDYNALFGAIMADIRAFVQSTNADYPGPDSAQAIVGMATSQYHRDGECEIDNMPIISEGDDNGAYVSAWVWVSFAGTPLDKETEEAADGLGYPDIV